MIIGESPDQPEPAYLEKMGLSPRGTLSGMVSIPGKDSELQERCTRLQNNKISEFFGNLLMD